MGGALKSVAKVFGGGDDMPAVAPAPATPTVSDPAVGAAADEEARKRANAGRASNIIAGAAEEEQKASAKRVLLGAGY